MPRSISTRQQATRGRRTACRRTSESLFAERCCGSELFASTMGPGSPMSVRLFARGGVSVAANQRGRLRDSPRLSPV